MGVSISGRLIYIKKINWKEKKTTCTIKVHSVIASRPKLSKYAIVFENGQKLTEMERELWFYNYTAEHFTPSKVFPLFLLVFVPHTKHYQQAKHK